MPLSVTAPPAGRRYSVLPGIENIIYFVLSVVFFQYVYWRSRETGRFAATRKSATRQRTWLQSG